MKKTVIFTIFVNHFISYLFALDIGKVISISNEAYITRGNKLLPLKSEFTIKENDYISTADNSKLKILFIDGTTLDIDKNSSLKISNYSNVESNNVNFMISNGDFELKIGTIPNNNFRIHTDNSIFLAKCQNMKIKISENIENIECLYNDELDENLEYETIKNPLDNNIENLSDKDFFN